MTATTRTLVVVALAPAGAGCQHHHRQVNAPGIVDPLAPPRDVTSTSLEYPGDPGERMLVVTTGVVGGASGGSTRDGALVDLGAEVTFSLGESERTHNDRMATLLLPRSVLLPPSSYGLTLGWSGLRLVAGDHDTDTTAGAVYAQVQRSELFGGVAAGLALDPTTGGFGPQLDAFFALFYLRGRLLFGDGWELGGGMYVKLPRTWVWRR